MNYHLKQKKYKKLLKELLYYRSEVEFQEEVLRTYGQKFTEFQNEYCSKHNIDLQALSDSHQTTIQAMSEDTNSRAVQPKTTNTKNFSKIYKQIARKIHPDNLDIEDDEQFKLAAEAYKNEDWGKLLEISEELGCRPQDFTKAMFTDMQQQILFLKKKVEVNATKYAWMYYECDEDEECIENLFKALLLHVYNYSAN